MASPMTMNRVIHAAVRRDLARLETALGTARDGDRARAGQLERAYANLQRELTQHHEGEDALIFPYLAQVGVDARPARGHGPRAPRDGRRARREPGPRWRRTRPPAGPPRPGAARESVGRTRVVVERHLEHEEDDLEPRIRPYLGTPEWQAVEKQVRPRSPVVTGRFLAWIQDGMTNKGRPSCAPPSRRRWCSPSAGWAGGRTAGRSRRSGGPDPAHPPDGKKSKPVGRW